VRDWLEPLYEAEAMRATDRWAIEEREVPSLELMERAGAGLADLAAEIVPAGRIAVACGRGNNGGDGLVAARLLRERGREADPILFGNPDDVRGDARANLDRLSEPPAVPGPAMLEGAAGVVDALLGTGFEGEPRGAIADAIAAINDHDAPVIAADVPSGVDASTGEVHGVAVRASATATFHAAKPGLWIHPGKAHAGEVRVIEIGIPPGAPVPARIGLVGAGAGAAIPSRGPASTKFSEGAVLLVGGSRGLTGAPSMAAESAVRVGAGYVTACVPASLNLIFELRLLEAMTVPLPEEDGALSIDGADEVVHRSQRAQAVVLGPGIGRTEGTVALARDLAARLERPLLLDADGLNAHAGRLDALARRLSPTVLTPHAGELGRLLEIDSASVEAARLAHVRRAADSSGAVVVLKGDDTLVAEPDGLVGVSRGASPALATAGTGDVLSGVTGALLAKGLHPFDAACAAVHLHARAGQIAAERLGPDAVVAGDVIAALPAARREARERGG